MPPQSKAPFSPSWFGRYVLVERLAEGGMAEIFLAVEQTAHAGRRFVILKRIHRDFAGDADYIEYFLTEGRVSLKLAHPNLPQAHEMGEVDGTYYLAMEYIRGVSVLDIMRAARKANTTVPVGVVVAIGAAVANALEHVHALRDVDGAPLRVVHRDVTPQNVMISYDGGVKLIDFGIAQAAVQSHRTQTGIVKGKLSYLAPEQIEQPATVDHRADLFSLGIVLHEMLTLRPLFRAKTDRETVARVLRMPVPSLDTVRTDLPAGLDAVVQRALARQLDQRYPSGGEMSSELERIAEEAGLALTPRRLKQDVETLCGKPEEKAAEPLALPPPPPQPPAEATPAPPQPQNTELGIARDPELVYFLRQAGAAIPPSRPRRTLPAQSDAELAALLASIDR